MSLVISVFLAESCIQDPEADFKKPTVSASYVSGNTYGEVVLKCQVSNPHFKVCGFWYGTTNNLADKKTLLVTGMSGTNGEARLTNLEGGQTYYFQAFADSGVDIATSAIFQFTIDDVMNVEANDFQLGYAETDIQVKVETSLPITVDLGGANWIQETQTKGLETYNKVFHIARNTELENRSATIRISSTNGKFQKEIPVWQSGGPIKIPDANFKAYLVTNFDQDGDREIVLSEAEAIENIDINTDEIESLEGMEYCIHLKSLQCAGTSGNPASGKLSNLDVTHCPELEGLIVWNNKLKEIDVSHCPNLKNFHPANNLLTTLDLTNNPELEYLGACGNQLTKIDLSQNTKITGVDFFDNRLTSIDLSRNTHLKSLNLGGNQIKSLDFSHNPEISVLSIQGEPLEQLPDIWSLPLVSLHVSHMVDNQPADFLTHFPNLESVNFSGYAGTTLDLSNNTKLREVWCFDMGNIQVLDLSASPGLKSLYCRAFDNTGWNKNLKAVYVHSGVVFENLEKNETTTIYYTDGNNRLNITPSSFEVDYKESVIAVKVDSNLDFTYEMGDIKWITFAEKGADEIQFKISRNYTPEDRMASFIIRTGNGQLEREVRVTQTGGPIEIPDANFKAYLVTNFDQDGDGEITRREAEAIERIDLSSDNIVSLQGIEFCPRLKFLQCRGTEWGDMSGSGSLVYLDVTHNPELEELIVFWNKLTSVDVSQCPKLRRLHLSLNLLTSLDITHNPRLNYLGAENNSIKSLDLSQNPELEEINIEENLLTQIDLSHNPKLKYLVVSKNPLGSLDISACPALTILRANRCSLEQIDLSSNPNLEELDLYGNDLRSIDLSKNRKIKDLSIYANPLERLPDMIGLPLRSLHAPGIVNDIPSDFMRNFPDMESVNISGCNATSMDFSLNTKLSWVLCSDMNNVTELDFSAAPGLKTIHCTNGSQSLKTVYIHTDAVLEDIRKNENTQIVRK